MRRGLRDATWPLPIALGAFSLIGLIAALTGDGWRDMVAWAALAAPVLTVAWARLAGRIPSPIETLQQGQSR